MTILFILLLFAFIFLLWRYSELRGKIEERAWQLFEEWRDKELEKLSEQKAEMLFEDWKRKYEKKIRKDAIEKSKSVIIGKITEHFAPFLPEFKYNPKDARFIGSPVDFIVFDGLDEGDLKKIVFLEVKTGKSPLSKREKLIKKIVESKKVEWDSIRLGND
ncbi:Holliday junction resolvase-like protein [Methanotorris formicicus Mc-S-70]|uniref:Holliday junction resolvase-like protein n=2 Tax=Methanotorris formicicus TaxID=213185 RepID=H1L195_9EURY|nr:Holliday junction resolvase-like protein [Methanotorris formicicus Mc-S-70]